MKVDGYGCRGNMSGIYNKWYSYLLIILYICKYIRYLLEYIFIILIRLNICWNIMILIFKGGLGFI